MEFEIIIERFTEYLEDENTESQVIAAPEGFFKKVKEVMEELSTAVESFDGDVCDAISSMESAISDIEEVQRVANAMDDLTNLADAAESEASSALSTLEALR